MNRNIFAMSVGTFAALRLTQALGQAAYPDADANLETIIVTGSDAALAAERDEIALTPGGVSLIDLEALKEQYVSSLADALRLVPGVWSVSAAGNDGIFYSSRGSNLDAASYDMNGIKLLQDGLPVTAADGNNHNRIVDPLASRFATMARGANALAYGASTLGGAVNFVTPTGLDDPGVDLSFSSGSHGLAEGRVSASGALGASGDGRLTIEGKRWEGYRAHNEQDRGGVYGNAGWRIDDRIETRFYLTALHNDQELSGPLTREQFDADPYQAQPAAVDGNFQFDVDTLRLANRTSWQLGADKSVEFGLSIEEQSLYHPIVWVAGDPDGPGPLPVIEFFSLLIDTDQRDVGTMFRYNQTIGRHDLVVGLNYGDNSVEGGNYRNLDGERNGLTTHVDNNAATTEFFALDRVRVSDTTTVIVAAQGVSADREVRNVAASSGAITNPTASYDRINPRFGIVYDVTEGASIYANLSRLFEPPTNFELEDNVAGGDATLEPMKGSVIEVGTRGERAVGSASRWGWDVALYYAEIEDEILSRDDPAAPGTSLVTNFDRTVHAGVEALVHSEISLGVGRGSLEPLLTATINDFKFDADPTYDDNDLPAAPQYFVRGELMYRNPSGFFVGPTVERVGKRWADFANTYSIDAYTMFGLRAGWSNDRLRVFADLRNLSDKEYVVYHSVLNVAAPDSAILQAGEPLSGYVGIEARF